MQKQNAMQKQNFFEKEVTDEFWVGLADLGIEEGFNEDFVQLEFDHGVPNEGTIVKFEPKKLTFTIFEDELRRTCQKIDLNFYKMDFEEAKRDPFYQKLSPFMRGMVRYAYFKEMKRKEVLINETGRALAHYGARLAFLAITAVWNSTCKSKEEMRNPAGYPMPWEEVIKEMEKGDYSKLEADAFAYAGIMAWLPPFEPTEEELGPEILANRQRLLREDDELKGYVKDMKEMMGETPEEGEAD